VALSDEARTDFINRYGQLLIKAWSDAGYSARLDSRARAELAAVGLVVPAGVEIVIDRSDPGEDRAANIDRQVELWVQGLAAGQVTLLVPAPSLTTAEIAEAELAQISIGRPPPACSTACSTSCE
jgi:hypothetical protein